MSNNVRCFRVRVDGYESAGLYWACSASKARYIAWASLCDTRGDRAYPLTSPDISVRRAPEYDVLQEKAMSVVGTHSNGIDEDVMKELVCSHEQ